MSAPENHSWVTQEMFDEELTRIVKDEGRKDGLLSISGIYEIVSEHFNNEVLKNLSDKRGDVYSFQVTINIEGDAFARDPWHELHKALLSAEKKGGEVLRRGEEGEVELLDDIDSPVLDTNGNTVGRVTLSRKPE